MFSSSLGLFYEQFVKKSASGAELNQRRVLERPIEMETENWIEKTGYRDIGGGLGRVRQILGFDLSFRKITEIEFSRKWDSTLLETL